MTTLKNHGTAKNHTRQIRSASQRQLARRRTDPSRARRHADARRGARSGARRPHSITMPEVRMTADLRLATIYVMPLGGKDVDAVIEALERNKKFLRGEIAHHVNLKFAPDIRFLPDERFDEAERIEKLLRTPAVRRDLEQRSGRMMTEIRRSLTTRRRLKNRRARRRTAKQTRQARRPWLGRARQAGRHDLDARGRRR